MDLLLSMDISVLIQHKVIEEVLNLVYDGPYSIDTNPLYLSSLWNNIEQMPTFSPKSVFKKLINNINTMGSWRLKKQSSVQFHIWKQCMRQRETDEMIFICLVSFTFILISYMISDDMSKQFEYQQEIFGQKLFDNYHLIEGASREQMLEYCQADQLIAERMYNKIFLFRDLKVFTTISYIASIFAIFFSVYSRQNIKLDIGQVLFEGTMVVSGILLNNMVTGQFPDTLSKECVKVMDLTPL